MAKPKIHIALLGGETRIEQFAFRRGIDELIVVYPDEKSELANKIIKQFSGFEIEVEPIRITSYDFNNILSSILSSLDNRKFDEYQIEFSITSENSVITLAGCVAAAITGASILCSTGTESIRISEVWPSELVNLTHKKREILAYLDAISHPIIQKEISRNTGIRESGISRHLRDLELAGYVKRYRVARIKHVHITELGSVVLHQKQIRKRRIWDSISNRSSEGIQTVGWSNA